MGKNDPGGLLTLTVCTWRGSAATVWASSCGNPAQLLHCSRARARRVQDVTVAPQPVPRGSPLFITISALVAPAGPPLTDGRMDLSVYFRGFRVYSVASALCGAVLDCPVQPGQALTLRSNHSMPSWVPAGPYGLRWEVVVPDRGEGAPTHGPEEREGGLGKHTGHAPSDPLASSSGRGGGDGSSSSSRRLFGDSGSRMWAQGTRSNRAAGAGRVRDGGALRVLCVDLEFDMT